MLNIEEKNSTILVNSTYQSVGPLFVHVSINVITKSNNFMETGSKLNNYLWRDEERVNQPQPAVLSSAPQESNAIIVWPLDHSLTSSQLS